MEDSAGLLKSIPDTSTEIEQLYLQALKIRQSKLGEISMEVERNLAALGKIHEKRNDFSKAEEYYRRRLEVARTVYGNQSPGLYWGLIDYARLLRRRGETSEADELEKQAKSLPVGIAYSGENYEKSIKS